MPIPYLTIKRECALKLAQLRGTSSATLETAYAGSWATALDGAEIPISSFRNAVLMIEKTFAQEIGNNPSHPARSLLYGASKALADLDPTPSYDSNGVEFVGMFDSCSDSVDHKPCTWVPTQTISDCNETFFDDTALYYYNITGAYIRTTRPTVILQGCVWDLTTQTEAYDADQSSPLPQYLAEGLVAGVIASAPQVGWTDASNVTQQNMAIYQQAIESCRAVENIPLASRNVVAG